MKKRIIISSLAAAVAIGVSAQINSPSPTGYIYRGEKMYSLENYLGTLDQMRQAATSSDLSRAQRSDVALYEALSALHRGDSDAVSLLRRWLKDNPESPRRADVLMCVADASFGKNFAEALGIYQEVNPAALADADRRDDLTYRTAYCYMQLGDYDRSLPMFRSLAGVPAYASAAKFYEGYIAYARRDYTEAKRIFLGVDASKAPGCMASYYLSQIYYLEGDYANALDTARKLLARKDVAPQFTAEANRVAGESLYQTGHASESIPYLKAYVGAVESPLISSQYILGLSEYGEGNYTEAIKYLRPVTEDNSAMGQNALVYLGQSLLKEGDTDAALRAFNRALHMTFDEEAREAAYYNYAVARSAGGALPFSSSVTVFEDFLTNFPNSAHADEVRRYIITGYITDNNYEAALASINRAVNPSAKVLEAKKQILYTLGTRALAADNPRQAVTYLSEAQGINGSNADIVREIHLSLGEAYYRTEEYRKAESQLKAFLANSRGASPQNIAVAHYDLGYTYLALQEWNNAEQQFAKVAEAPGGFDGNIRVDVLNRLGDSRYYQKEWKSAVNAYDRAFNLSPTTGDYPLYRKSLINGYMGNFNEKKNDLVRLITDFPTSALIPDAMLELTEAQLQTGDKDGAFKTWQALADKYPDTRQGRQAYLQMALTFADMGKTDKAMDTYRHIIRTYPTSDEAAQAAETMKHMAAEQGTLDEYTQFLAGIENAPKIDSVEAERLSFTAAEKLFLNKKGSSRLAEYVKKYPEGKYAVQAYTYLLDEAESTDDKTKAYNYACRIVENWPDNAAAEDAYAVKAAAEYERGLGEDALASWQQLERRASTPEMMNKARMGIMRVTRDLGMAEPLRKSAEDVLSSSALGASDRNEASYSLAKAHQLSGNNKAAIEIWRGLASSSDDLYGAKSAVALAEALLAQGDLKEAFAVADKFVSSDTPHTYWLGRGFITLSDILRKQGKTYEADEYLRALRENYPGKEADIFTMIDERLNK